MVMVLVYKLRPKEFTCDCVLKERFSQNALGMPDWVS